MGQLIKQYPSVPSADNSDNSNFAEVIGNKTDRSFSDGTVGTDTSVMGHLRANYNHVHDSAKCYPVLADPVTIAASSNAWTDYGDYVEIIPVDTITSSFDIHWVHTGEISATGNYVLELASGLAASEVTIGQIAFSRDSNQVQTASQPIQIPPQPTNTRISARLSSGNAQANTADIKVYYHNYPEI